MSGISKIVKLTSSQYATKASASPSQLESNAMYLIVDEEPNKNVYLDLVYPIGSIFISNEDVSPSSTIGGSWIKLPSDIFLRSATSGVSNDDNTNGGSNTAYMPTHTHNMNHTHPDHIHSVGFAPGSVYTDACDAHTHSWHRDKPGWGRATSDMGYAWGSDYYRFNNGGGQTGWDGYHGHTINTLSVTTSSTSVSLSSSARTGNAGSYSVNNMPCYKNVYMWRRES